MIAKSVYLIFAITTVLGICKTEESSTLKAVAVVFRHGERTIIHPYSTDPHINSSNWDIGLGQLTNVGKIHHFRVGRWFRNHYNDFLPKLYSPKHIRINSTDVDRTLMSVSTHLAGLFPPSEKQQWHPLLMWQPIPIHTKPWEEDPVLAAGKYCPRHVELYDDLVKEEIQKNKEELQDLFNYISQHTGRNLSTFKHLRDVHDTLFVEKEDYGLELPAWTSKIYPYPLRKWSDFAFSLDCYTQELAKLKIGPFLNELIDHFNNVENDGEYQRYRIYSSHDLNVANLLTAFGAYNGKQPPYASALIFEFRQKADGSSNFVNLLYKNSTNPDLDPVNVNIKGCAFNCKFEDFKSTLNSITVNVTTWEKQCQQVKMFRYLKPEKIEKFI